MSFVNAWLCGCVVAWQADSNDGLHVGPGLAWTVDWNACDTATWLGGFCFALLCLLSCSCWAPPPNPTAKRRREIAETLRCSRAVAEVPNRKNNGYAMDSLWIGDGWLRHLRGQRTSRGLLSINVMACVLVLDVLDVLSKLQQVRALLSGLAARQLSPIHRHN